MKNRSFLQKIIGAPYLVWAAIFIVVPLFIVAYFAFTDKSGAFTFRNIRSLTDYAPFFRDSILYSLAATVISLVLAYPFAYVMSRKRERTQQIMMVLVMLPMWMSLLILTYSWVTIMEQNGVINTILKNMGFSGVKMIGTPGAVIFGMVYNYIPYMILPIYSVMAKMDVKLIEAARDLGCNGAGVLRRVIWPLSLPGVISGVTMVLIPSISTFYISQKLGNGKFYLIGDAIEGQYTANNLHFAAAIAFILMVILLFGMAFMQRFANKRAAV